MFKIRLHQLLGPFEDAVEQKGDNPHRAFLIPNSSQYLPFAELNLHSFGSQLSASGYVPSMFLL